MKKSIIGLMAAMLMAAAGNLWAQDLRLNGYLNTGLGVIFDNSDLDPSIKMYSAEAEQQGYRFRLNGSYTNEAKNAGAMFRLQSQATRSTGNFAGYFSLPYVYGWVGFLNNMVTVSGGIIEDSTWSTGDWYLAIDSISHYTGLGALLKLTPVDGLILGFGSYVMNRRGGGDNNALMEAGFGRSIHPEWVKYTFHGVFTMPDTFRAGVSYRTANTAGGGKGDQSSRLFGDFRFLGMSGLTAVVSASADNLEEFSKTGNIIISETFALKASDEVNIGLNMLQFLYNREENDEKVDYDPGLLFNPWVSYALGSIVPRLDIVYFMGGCSALSLTSTVDGNVTRANTNEIWPRRAFFSTQPSKKDVDNDYSLFSVRPSVRVNLDGRTYFELGYLLNFDSAKNDGAYAINEDPANKSRISHAVYFDIRWNF